jgi:very-short-patch-repair endonuclease
MYEEGFSLAQFYRETGVASVTLLPLLEQAGIPIRRQITIPTIAQDLEFSGFTKSMLEEDYLEKNLKASVMVERLQPLTRYTLTARTFDKLLAHYNIRKTPEQVKQLQGLRSREERAANEARLSLLGLTPQELADLYCNDLSMTYGTLVPRLNDELLAKDLKATPLTERWVSRVVAKYGDPERLKGVSRIENNFAEWLKTVCTAHITRNSRVIIPPYELDFYIKELKLAIEFNGDYWHSDSFMVENHGMTADEYHALKTEHTAAKGLKLLFVWESEWVNTPELVKERILSTLEHP